MATNGRLCRSHPQGNEACGPASRAVDQVRVGDQRSDRPYSRPRGAADAARPRRRGDRMIRREFITLLGRAAAAWPLTARAQQPVMPVIGFLNSASPDEYAPMVASFREGLKETGYIEGQNVAIDYRWAGGQYDRVPALAAELVRRQVAVIVANSPGVQAVKAAITTIPIVFTTGSDPVQIGLVASLSRPGGNVTGVTQLYVEVMPKRLELAHELVPTATIIAALVNPTHPNAETIARDLQAAARILGVQLHVLHA